MDQYKPPGLIKKIYFSKLTFGESPIRIDNVWVEDEGEDHVLLEVTQLPPAHLTATVTHDRSPLRRLE